MTTWWKQSPNGSDSEPFSVENVVQQGYINAPTPSEILSEWRNLKVDFSKATDAGYEYAEALRESTDQTVKSINTTIREDH